MQPIEYVGEVIRFRENKAVRWMYDRLSQCGISMNEIVLAYHKEKAFTVDDMEQLYQLIGYSVSGFGDLNIPRPETVVAAGAIAAELYAKKEASNG